MVRERSFGKSVCGTVLWMSFCTLPNSFADAKTGKVQMKNAERPLPAKTASETLSMPRLIVLVTIDQMRADTLDRYTPAMRKQSAGQSEGLVALREKGVWFADAWTASAPTVTAAGHASICSGANPSRHGIVGNEIYDTRLSGIKLFAHRILPKNPAQSALTTALFR